MPGTTATTLTTPASALKASRRAQIIADLNTSLAYLVDMHVCAKQAHWNIHGPNFSGLHPLFDTITDAVAAQIEGESGEVKKREYWGLRNLAYRIKKNRKGHYVLLGLDAQPAHQRRELPRRDDVAARSGDAAQDEIEPFWNTAGSVSHGLVLSGCGWR